MQAAAAALTQCAAAIAALVNALQGKLAAPQSQSPSAPSPSTVTEAVNAFLIAKARAQKSDRYLRAMKNSLSKLARVHGGALLDDLTAEMLERWLDRSPWSGTTRRGYLRDGRTLFHFAVRRGLASRNGAALVELPAATAAAAEYCSIRPG